MIDFSKPTTNLTLTQLCVQFGIKDFHGCFMRNEFPLKPKQGHYIINLDDTSGRGGTHWVCCYVSKKCALYHDSYGQPMPEEVKVTLKKNCKEVYYSCTQKQQMTSQICGYYCVLFIYFLSQTSFALYQSTGNKLDAANKFDLLFGPNARQNDKQVEKNMLHLIKAHNAQINTPNTIYRF